jgi:septum formation topological specificity factor MinE
MSAQKMKNSTNELGKNNLQAIKAILRAADMLKNAVAHLKKEEYEPFVLPDFDELEGLLKKAPMPDDIKNILRYTMSEREIYDVFDKFDESPDKLSSNEKQLRKKFLEIILKLVNTYENDIKVKIKEMSVGLENSIINLTGSVTGSVTGSDTGGGPALGSAKDPPQKGSIPQKDDILKYVEGNINPTFNTIKRIINLLIMEIDLSITGPCITTPCITTPCITTPCNKNPYIAVIVFLGIFSLIFVITSIVLYRQKNFN